MSHNEIIEKFSTKFNLAIKKQLRSDVETAFYLSGGVDSNSICSVASKMTHFTTLKTSIICTIAGM